MRQDYAEFTRRGAEVIAVGPEGPDEFRRYWAEQQIPFVGLADPKHRVANTYGQEVNLLKLGRVPALIVVDGKGDIRYRHYGSGMRDIPPNSEVLGVVDQLLAESAPRANLG